MPFIGAPSPKELQSIETISDRKTYTGDGIKTIFGVSYESNHISVFQNGLKLIEGIDYNIASTGQYITFVIAPESGDVIDLVGASGVTNLAQSSYSRETFVSLANQTSFILSTNIDDSFRTNVYVNGIRLTETDYTIYNSNNTLEFNSALAVDDTVAIELIKPGFRIVDGTLDVSNLTQTSYAREAFENISNTSNVILSSNIDASTRLNVFFNGARLHDTSFTIDVANNKVTFNQSISANDVIEFDIFSPGFRTIDSVSTGISNFSQSSYNEEVFQAIENQTVITLDTDINSSYFINVYNNGIRLNLEDYTFNYSANTITFTEALFANDVITVDTFRPGFRIQGVRTFLSDLVDVNSTATANQVLTADGTGNFYFANTAGGSGSVSLASFTANGTITTGDTVALRIDNGEIEKIAHPIIAQYTEVSQTLSEATTTGTTFFDVDYDENTSSAIVAQRSSVSPFNGLVSIGTVTETSNTTTNGETTREVGFNWGTPVAWNSDNISNTVVAIDTDQNKVVITYINNSDAINIYAVVGDISGNSITFGTPLELYTTRSRFNSIVYDTNSNKMVIYFQDYNSFYMYYAVCTVSGTNITLDSPVTFIVTTASNAYSTALYIPELNKHVLLYHDTSNYVTIMIGELANGTITWGSAVTVQSAAGITPICRYDSVNEKLLLYIGQNTADSNYQSVFIGTITNNSVTFGSAIRVSTANPFSGVANIFVHHKASNKFIIGGADGNNSSYPYYNVVKIDDSAPNGLSISGVTDIVSTGSTYFGLGGGVYASNFEKIFVRIRLDNTTRPNVWTYNPEYTSYDLTTTNATNYIGIAKDSVNNGQVSEVFLVGDIADNQTGLTVNQNYYLTGSGLLTTSSTSYGLIGRAVSDTSIQLLQTTSKSLTDLNITDGTSGQVLKTYGNNAFYFADEENLNAILYSIALG